MTEKKSEFLEEVPFHYLSGMTGQSFDFDLLDEHASVILPHGEGITEAFISAWRLQNKKFYRYVDHVPHIIDPVAIQTQAVETANLFLEIRNSKILTEGNFSHTQNSMTEMVETAFKHEFAEGQLALQKEVRGLDSYTYLHAVNSATLAIVWGLRMRMPMKAVVSFGLAAYYQDVGKNRIPLTILHKNTPLDQREKAITQTHTQLGYLIISECLKKDQHNEMVRQARLASLLHHLRFDGKGYPNVQQLERFRHFDYQGLPEIFKYLSIVDFFCALIEDRPWRPALSVRKALRVLLNESEKNFDIVQVNMFLNLMSISLNHRQPFYEVGEYVVLEKDFSDRSGRNAIRELARVLAIDINHIMRPKVEVLFDLARNRKMPANHIDLNRDIGRRIIRIMTPDEVENLLKIQQHTHG